MDTGEGLQLGYLVLGVRQPARWHGFLQDMLGLVPGGRDGVDGWRMDGAVHRLLLQPDASDDVLALGLDAGGASGLARTLARLRAHGAAVQEADDALRMARGVQALHLVRDPAGVCVEVFHGLAQVATPFASAAFPQGFVTGPLGMGHAVLVSRDTEAMERFYTGALGFGVTERLDARVGPIRVRGTFLHCNPRHHTLALFNVPSRKRLHHFMLEASGLMDVGCAFERAARLKVPLSLGLGQHPSPDGTFSFYGTTPSGFDFEVGAGAGLIDPAGWVPAATATTSTWGHAPRLRLKLRAARDMLLGRAR